MVPRTFGQSSTQAKTSEDRADQPVPQSCDSEHASEQFADREHASKPQKRGNAALRFGINAASLLAGNVINRGTTFVIYALVARYCGAHSFGQLSLGLMLLYSFQVLASVGLPTLIVRDVAKNPKSDARYFVHACIIVVLAFAICYAALGLFVAASGYAADTRQVILLLGLSILPWSLSLIVESLFRAKERMHLILWAAIPVHLAKMGIAIYALKQGYGVTTIAMLLLTSHVAMFLVQLGILLPTLNSRFPRLKWTFCRCMLNRSWKFCGIDALVALWASVNVVLLSWFSSEEAVGVFGAAVQLLIPPQIALQAIVNSLFPVMCRRAEENRERSRALVVMMFEILTFIAVPGCALLWFCAKPLIALIYSDQGFVDSAMLVRIMLLSLVCNAMTRLLGQLLMSYRQEHINLRIVAVDVVFNIICGTFLISAFGITGAAFTVLLTSLVNCGLHLLTTRSLLATESASSTETRLLIFWRMLAATAAMAAVFVAIGDANFLWSLTLAIATFLIVFGVLCYLSRAGMNAFREQFLIPLSES